MIYNHICYFILGASKTAKMSHDAAIQVAPVGRRRSSGTAGRLYNGSLPRENSLSLPLSFSLSLSLSLSLSIHIHIHTYIYIYMYIHIFIHLFKQNLTSNG